MPPCRVMVQSFVSTQKQSVQRSMARKFAQFIGARGDNLELVLTVLRVCRPWRNIICNL